ncbi:glycoside hydrolase family 16 protein [Luteococcus peritonei]|uniref:Glycoside hydrolase family 16 protein n=1 Tax=Luteococcus peritonei TaxID=88874 RepID=A0ABW4RY68_9ACTN
MTSRRWAASALATGAVLGLTLSTAPAGAQQAAPAAPSLATSPMAAPATGTPTIDEQFSSWPAGSNTSAAGTLRINGDWTGTGGNQMLRSNVRVADGVATMTSRANQKSGAELQTAPDKLVGKGYYETSMQMSSTPGILSGMFFMGKDYTFPEVDMEIRSRDNGPGKSHYIFYTVHYAGGGHQYKQVELPFDPAAGQHTYGFLLGTTSISFYVDGQQTHTWQNLPANLGLGSTEPQGYLMTNSWAQDSEWVGALPAQDTATRIDWIRHWGGATSPQFTPAG